MWTLKKNYFALLVQILFYANIFGLLTQDWQLKNCFWILRATMSTMLSMWGILLFFIDHQYINHVAGIMLSRYESLSKNILHRQHSIMFPHNIAMYSFWLVKKHIFCVIMPPLLASYTTFEMICTSV